MAAVIVIVIAIAIADSDDDDSSVGGRNSNVIKIMSIQYR